MVGETDIKDGDEQSPNWVRPDIYEPRSGTVLPGFMVKANIDVLHPSKWQLKIMEGDKQLYFVEESAGQWFNHYVEKDVIKPGSKFVVHVHYFLTLAWSQWASMTNLVMGVSKPVITEPVEGVITGSKPRVSGRGYPGATVKLCQAGSGVILYGTAVVDQNGNWETVPVVNFPEGEFELTTSQAYNNVDSDWSDSVRFTVNTFTLSPPTIRTPADGSVVTTNRPDVFGRGFPGALVKLYQANVGNTVFGSAYVPPSGNWSISPSVNFPEGVFSMTANQSGETGTSDWASTVTITVDL
jgi:hypothetical protein